MRSPFALRGGLSKCHERPDVLALEKEVADEVRVPHAQRLEPAYEEAGSSSAGP